MGQVLQGCATTTETVRRAIQNSLESLRQPAKRYGINQKTAARLRKPPRGIAAQARFIHSAGGFHRGRSRMVPAMVRRRRPHRIRG